ncbi:MAG TPA: carbonic anhydrase family protein [Flavitalea sp.]|nr:carbonic anhydrase family protein [Flavitalea sp.]
MRTITKEMRDSLTPLQALDLLKEGNKRFMNNLKVNRNLLQQVNETAAGQYPFAFILSCIDSRTSAELIFDQGLGDIFSCRIAGNILNDDILGSMEFACKIAGTKVIVVLGHTRCGAVKGACEGVKMGHLTGLLEKIQSIAADEHNTTIKPPTDPLFVDHVARLNVKHVMNEIPGRSPIIAEMLQKGDIVIAGGLYEVETGHVQFFEREIIAFVPKEVSEPTQEN